MTTEVVLLSPERQRELVAEAMPTVRRIVAQRCRIWPSLVRKSGLSVDELVAVGNLELCTVVRTFNETAGVPFPAFAWKAVDGAVTNAIKKETRLQRAAASGLHKAAPAEPNEPPSYGETTAESRQAAVDAFTDAIVAGMLLDLDAADPEHHALTDELRKSVRQSVAELSPKDRRLVEAHHYEDQSLEEAGVVQGISRSTVKRRHRKILARLGARLRGLGVDGAGA